jgi:hypothetical protein
MIRVMASPFRYNKKQRRDLRRDAKSSTKAADGFEADGTKSQAVVVLHGIADFSTRMSLARRRKKKSKNSK